MVMLPTGVSPWKMSSSTLYPICSSWLTIHLRESDRGLEPAGRGPKLTRCFKSSKARPPLKAVSATGAGARRGAATAGSANAIASAIQYDGRLNLRISLFPFFTKIDEPGKSDAHNVEAHQGNPYHEDGSHIVGRHNGRRHNSRQQHRITKILNQEPGRHDAENGEQQDD